LVEAGGSGASAADAAQVKPIAAARVAIANFVYFIVVMLD
jgi:hypothetical protein